MDTVWFDSILSGWKSHEMRMLDEKRREWKVGDLLLITERAEKPRKMKVTITDIRVFSDLFNAVYGPYDHIQLMPGSESREAVMQAYQSYYPKEKRQGMPFVVFELADPVLFEQNDEKIDE